MLSLAFPIIAGTSYRGTISPPLDGAAGGGGIILDGDFMCPLVSIIHRELCKYYVNWFKRSFFYPQISM